MKKKKLITSALPYINGDKHIGNLIGSILPADIYARFLRQQGEEVLFICGTDEHGAPAEIGAQISKTLIKDYCNKNHFLQKSLYQSFNISFDYFGRTSSLIHHKFTQQIFSIIDEKDYILTNTIKQYYSKDDERFLPDRYIEGECPHCHYQQARGDQCDYCGTLLESIELIQPHSILSPKSKLYLKDSQHLFFNLTKLENELYQWTKNHINWPNLVKGIAKKWFKEGLRPRCITRDLAWGINVNKHGFYNKVFYVWFDALLGYISITKEWSQVQGHPDGWQDWWLNPNNVELIQFMAKDNVPFHIILWPAIMMATKLNWTLPTYIKGVNWLTYENNKFSTSKKRGVFLTQALKLFPVDYWRYALFCMIPENSDTNFSFRLMANIINKDLADKLGNFINRLVTIIIKDFNGILPTGFCIEETLELFLKKEILEFEYYMKKLELRKAGAIIRCIWSKGNEYLTKKQPWYLIKSDVLTTLYVLKNCLWLLHIYSCILAPIIPNIADKLLTILPINQNGFPSAKKALHQRDWLYNEIVILHPQKNLISKISEQKIAQLTNLFPDNA